MEISGRKSIRELSWNVTENEYRADSAISYSQLSSFARESQKVIPHLQDKKDTEALRFGSLVDCLLTEPETLEERFLIVDLPKVSDKVRIICDKAFAATDGARSLHSMNKDVLLNILEGEDYYSNWKDNTRLDQIILKGTAYYNLLSLTGDKILMSTSDYKRAVSCVTALKESPFTKDVFLINPFDGNIEKFYQLKFRVDDLAEAPVRCMMDFCIVNHTDKTIRPIDVKTTGKDEEKFEDSFIQWLYMLQGTLYTQTLEHLIRKDEYFKHFTILPYWFTVINKFNQTPMIWEFDDALHSGSFIDEKTGEYFKGWRQLLHEFLWHRENQKYDYSYETYQSNGIRKIRRLKHASY